MEIIINDLKNFPNDIKEGITFGKKNEISELINKFGRLPINSDVLENIPYLKFYKNVANLSPGERIQLYDQFEFKVPDEEFDYIMNTLRTQIIMQGQSIGLISKI